MLRKTGKSQEITGRYEKALSYIESFSNMSVEKGKKGSPEVFVNRTRRLLQMLGRPDAEMKFMHVTGTAGKGTVSAFIHDMLVRDGKRAGLFTSPYVTAATEQIKADDLYISPEDFADIVDELRLVIERPNDFGRPTASELFFLAAILYFKRKKCEWAVIEAGIGGRYDATNTIEFPEATIITNIDLDHTKILGKTLEEIAYDKAGIIKKGGSFYTAEPRQKLLSMFKKVCAKEDSRFKHIKSMASSRETGKALAEEVARDFGISTKAIESSSVSLPCRFETVSHSPRVILDGAHDRIKMRSALTGLDSLQYEKLHLVLGMGSISPDSKKMLPVIIPCAHNIIIAGSGDMKRKLANPEAVLKLVGPYVKKGARISVCDRPYEALDKALESAGKNDCVLVTGSFFLAGELRKRWFPEKWVLEHRKSFK